MRPAVRRDSFDEPGPVKKMGSFRIAPDGTVVRFPGVPRRFWTAPLPSRGALFVLG